jgi:hypothetical protein
MVLYHAADEIYNSKIAKNEEKRHTQTMKGIRLTDTEMRK